MTLDLTSVRQVSAAERSATDGADTQTLVILGASGDLTARLLLPGLGGLLASDSVGDLHLIGSAVDDWDDERWRWEVAESFAAADANGHRVDAAIKSTRYLKADVTDDDELRALLAACSGRLILYFALSPDVTVAACEVLTRIGVPEGTQLVMEMPFGTDAESATALSHLVTRLVPEEHVHRIDHFAAMSPALNVEGLWFANRIIEPLLNSHPVESVDVVFDEGLALEGRAGFYDSTGAMVEMIQGHLLEVMAVFAMEPAPTWDTDVVRDAMAQILRATHVWHDDPVTYSRRARYTAGEIEGHPVPCYADGDGVDGARGTETFAELVLAVDTCRWAGVPFRLRTGKALGSPRSEVTVTFKPTQQAPTAMAGNGHRNRLRIGVALDTHRQRMDVGTCGPDSTLQVAPVDLEGELDPPRLPPYGEVLKGVLDGDPPLTVRGEMAAQCWRIIEPVRQAWRENQVALQEYEAGSDGPTGWPPTGLPTPTRVG